MRKFDDLSIEELEELIENVEGELDEDEVDEALEELTERLKEIYRSDFWCYENVNVSDRRTRWGLEMELLRNTY